MALTRWVGWFREVVRAVRGLPDEDLRRQTLAIHEQLIRLRKHRLAQEELREKAALNDLRRIVEEMKELENNLVEAEKATAEYVNNLAEEVKTQMEADLNAEADIMVGKLMNGNQILSGVDECSSKLKTERSSGSVSAAGASERGSDP